MTATRDAAATAMHAILDRPWRVGRKLGRTVYVQIGREPSDEDPLLGLFDFPGLAAEAVYAHNSRIAAGTVTVEEARIRMIGELYAALYGRPAPARPVPPKVVWEELLAEVRERSRR